MAVELELNPVETDYDDEAMNRPALQQLLSAMNLSDRLYAAWFLGLGLAVLLLPHRVAHWNRYLALHGAALAAIVVLSWQQARSSRWRFWHDWYPVLLFIVAFEETAKLSFLFRDGWQDNAILALERRAFVTPPTVWLERLASPWFTELMEIGYFSFYLFFIVAGGVLYARARSSRSPLESRVEAEHAFRDLMDATVTGFIVCYLFYLLFPTESPARTLAQLHSRQTGGGPFHWAVNLIQHHAGVHGSAFPSGHIMSAAVTLLFALLYKRRLGLGLLPFFVLMCVGSVYDRYHYLSDVVGGVVVGVLAALPFLFRRRNKVIACAPAKS